MAKFKIYRQHDQMDCGPTCLRMVAKHHGRNYTLETLRKKSGINREGVSLLGISEAAESIGLRTVGAKLTWQQLKDQAPMPCIVYWDQYHFVVVYRIKGDKVYVADPDRGRITYTKEEFLQNWLNAKENGRSTGIVLLLYTTPKFYERTGEKRKGLNFEIILQYILPYKNLLFQIALGLLAGSILQLIFPFLTQAVVDIGINTRDLNFIYLVLIAQVMLFLGRTSVEFIRSWILLHMNTRINVSILADFLIKLMKLPMPFFDTKMVGDIMQRMEDHRRIQSFLTGQTLGTLFSFVNLLVYSVVLVYYNLTIFFVFLVCSTLYVTWVLLFLKKRRELDHQRFGISSSDQSKVIQLIQGMQSIKLNNCERQKRWEWERLQARLFRYRVSNLKLNQYQQGGAFFINEGKNIAITFIAAVAVVNGQLTLGAMMAIQYIIGQLNSPISQLISFVQSAQDAHISLERLNEVHEKEDEEPEDKIFVHRLPEQKNITLENLTFTYPGAGNEPVVKGVDLQIPEGKTTALVGMSGCGKTTLLKILLKFYQPEKGQIRLGDRNFSMISPRTWRSHCGVVMQDGYIFSDSITGNIAVGEEHPDLKKVEDAAEVANIHQFIESLPLGYNTKIGSEGNGISEGQKQRILIARAVYKDPQFIFLDEATNALDANNERRIMGNLEDFLEGRTVIVVAHRLSTVKNADNIVVLEDGELSEQGTHIELLDSEGAYFDLVENQLELDGQTS
ncbi:peptidase domain-containing ABC transporter [Aliifodinibius sp. S!AR15-10]|uniref:peptidase domain-containing ABC transporter n=1 Tax=Aliifodinibius sp. S!AR15-10 TaxID=2950437 RepID=UPI00286238EF|nr:peptidase domain-containing ABC transporter [Aliifodinibius sp. S!AR15-10]MDR8393848.1 peptidase domain-containing ABC transporter [Aliifodinibius sp. S!AR15-10]